MSTKIRRPAVAGTFYPSDTGALRDTVEGFLRQVDLPESVTPPKALIVPHAGYIYSGPIAASAYAHVQPADTRRVILLGPAHRVGFEGIAAPEALVWETPLGEVLIDFQTLEKVISLPQVMVSDVVHEQEHCLEVQLPFLQTIFKNMQLVPLLVGDASADEVAEVIESLWGDPETLIVVSSDLSHYYPDAAAKQMDRATADAILDLNVDGLTSESACGRRPIAGLLTVAQHRGLRPELLDLRTSGATAGPDDQVVGYGAFAFYD